MKNKILLMTLLSAASTSAFAERSIYQETYTKDTCMLIHTTRDGFEKYDLYSSPNIFGKKDQATLIIHNNIVSIEGKKFKSFCTNGAVVSHSSDKLSAQCSNASEGKMVVKENSDGTLREVQFTSRSINIVCRDLKKVE